MNGTTKKRIPILVWQLLLGLTFLLVWEFGAVLGFLEPLAFSRPSKIAERLWQLLVGTTLWPNLATTFLEAALSFTIGSLLGIVCGFVLARSPRTAAVFEPYLRIANSIPRVVFAPIFVIMFGLQIWSKVALGIAVVFFLVFFNTFRGLREVDVVMIDNARMLGASERQLIRHVLIPSALTWIFSSLHVSIGLAIIAVIVGEYVGSYIGIGHMIQISQSNWDPAGGFAGITVLSLVVLAVGSVVDRVERRLMRWKPERSGLGMNGPG
jgi:NitT/TauT family transport system permease protein